MGNRRPRMAGGVRDKHHYDKCSKIMNDPPTLRVGNRRQREALNLNLFMAEDGRHGTHRLSSRRRLQHRCYEASRPMLDFAARGRAAKSPEEKPSDGTQRQDSRARPWRACDPERKTAAIPSNTAHCCTTWTRNAEDGLIRVHVSLHPRRDQVKTSGRPRRTAAAIKSKPTRSAGARPTGDQDQIPKPPFNNVAQEGRQNPRRDQSITRV